MNIFIFLVAFIVSLFIYLHISEFVKTSKKLEVYNLSFENKDTLMDVIKDKQPFVLRNLNQEYFSNTFSFFSLPLNFEMYKEGEKDIHVYNYKEFIDMNKDSSKLCQEGKLDIDKYLKYQKNESFQYFSKNNGNKINYLGLVSKLRGFDIYLKPDFHLRTKYDMWMGMKGMQTGLSFSLGSYFYIILKKGKAKVRCFLPNHNSKLFSKFTSVANINVWDNKTKIKQYSYIDVELNKGDIMHIPTYWPYSLYYQESSVLFTIDYENVMSMTMGIPYKAIEYISILNIDKKKVKDSNILKPIIQEPITQPNTKNESKKNPSKENMNHNEKINLNSEPISENENKNVLNMKE